MKKSFSIILFMLIVGLFLISCTDEEENSNPVIASVTINPSTINSNGIVTVSVIATDIDGDVLTYSYMVSGGAITGSGPTVTWTAPSVAGAHSINVTVTDGKGGQALYNGSLTVVEAVTRITGTAAFPAGTSADLSNSKVSIYTTLDNWNNNQPIRFASVTGSGASVNFVISNVVPGNYYLDVWKDNDNDGTWSIGDYVGVYGDISLGSPGLTEFQISEEQTFNCTIDMIIW